MKEQDYKKAKAGQSELKKIHNKQEQQSMLFETESLLIQEKDVNREIEKFQLRNGTVTSIKDIKDLIRGAARKYQPMF